MKKKLLSIIVLLFIVLMLVSCEKKNNSSTTIRTRESIITSTEPSLELKDGIKNLIIFIGDGMGYEQVKGAELCNDIDYPFTNFKNVSVNTNSLEPDTLEATHTTDSAAGGTAISAGTLTINHYVGVDSSENNLETILDYAKSKNMKTGIATTDVISGATPAAFSAHNKERNDEINIVKDQLTSGVDLIVGAYSIDTFNIANAYRTNNRVYDDYETFSELTALSKPTIGLFDIEKGEEPISLSEILEKVMELLENENGFVLMVEQAHIDKYAHDGKFAYMVNAVESLSNAVDTIIAKHGNDTALIITADHETGALDITLEDVYNKKYKDVYYYFGSTGHSNSDICLYYLNFDYKFSNLKYYQSNDRIKNTDTYIISKDIIDEINK